VTVCIITAVIARTESFDVANHLRVIVCLFVCVHYVALVTVNKSCGSVQTGKKNFLPQMTT
jgi:hypothetical protein